MKKSLWIWFFAICIIVAAAGPACAGWGKCVGCHSGAIAPTKGTLKEKFKTLDEFVKGALTTENSMMNGIKKDPDGIRDAAKEIGYTDPEQKGK